MIVKHGFFRNFLTVLLAVTLLFLQSCSNKYEEDIKNRHSLLKQRLADLGGRIDSGQIANAVLLTSYADLFMDLKPEFKEVAEVMRSDATTKGPLYQGLLLRLEQVNKFPENKPQYVPAFQELEALWSASDPVIYNDSLIDVINTLADLSDGGLSRINIPGDAKTAVAGGSEGKVPGSYLVGNPNYGHWRSGSSGNSFWAWYGQYALLTSLTRGFGGGYYHAGPIYHDSWYGRSRYSYYHDYGRGTYGSYSDRQSWDTRKQRLKSKGIRTPKSKSYGSVAGRKRVSTYASMRSKSASNLRVGRGATKRTSTFFGGSSRGTTSRSRGGWGGK